MEIYSTVLLKLKSDEQSTHDPEAQQEIWLDVMSGIPPSPYTHTHQMTCSAMSGYIPYIIL